MARIDELSQAVADEQKQLDGQSEATRTRVLRLGKLLRQLQKEQKKQQPETGQTWKEWCEEQKGVQDSFPHDANVRKYMLICKYPSAYEKGMSIKEAYKQAGQWKKNGGNPPLKSKVAISRRTLVALQRALGKVEKRLDYIAENDIDTMAREEKWDSDEVAGAMDALQDVRRGCNACIRKIRESYDIEVTH